MSEDAAALTNLVYYSKKSNGYDKATMAVFTRDGRMDVTPARMAQHCFWVAHEGDTILGCAALDPRSGTVGELRTFFIDPKYKGLGVGKLLWLELRTIAQSQGFTHLVLDADPNAISFYESLGFVITQMVESKAIKGRMIPRMGCDI